MIQGNLLIEHLSSNYCYCNSISQPVVSDALTGIGEVVLSSSFTSEKISYSIYVISGFRREADENCVLLVFYTAYNGSFVPTFRDSISVQWSSQDP